MTIQRKNTFILYASVVVIVFTAALVWWASDVQSDAMEASAELSTVVSEISNLNMLTAQFIAEQGGPTQITWLDAHDRASAAFAEFSRHTAIDPETQQRVRGELEEARMLFSGLVVAETLNSQGNTFESSSTLFIKTNTISQDVVLLHRAVTDTEVQAEHLAENVSIASLILLAGMIIFNIVMLRHILTKPLVRLISTLERMTDGDLSVRAEEYSHDEIGAVARAFNTMADRLQGLYGELEQEVADRTKALENQQLATLNVLEDVSAERQKLAAQAIELSKFQRAVDATSDSVIITDASANVLYANTATADMTGYSLKEILGTKCGALWGGHMDGRFYRDMWRALTGEKKTFVGELSNCKKTGEEFRTRINITPILDDEGKVQFFVELMQDVTDDYLHKQELQKFALALEATSDQVVITDPDGIIVYANPAAERITGYTHAEIFGKKAGVKELWGGQMDEEFYQKMWHTVKVEKKSFLSEITNKRKNGELYTAFATISPVVDDAGDVTFFVGIERDITKEKAVDRAKTEFVSLASHQLRTPLSSVSWYTEMLLAGDAGKVTVAQKKYLEEIYSSNQRMVDLVNALLSVSRLELGTFMVEPEQIDIIELARSVVREQEAQINARQLTLTTQFEEGALIFEADPKLLRMVFQNLLSNAVKYTPAHGHITFSIARDRKRKVVDIRVADSGIGIPLGEQGGIFSKLFRATNARESDTDGTGLGLYIVKLVIEHSGGSVRFESGEGRGTVFFVTLPLSGMVKKVGIGALSD